MKELTVQQIEHNWKKLRDIIQNTFDDDRLINLNKINWTDGFFRKDIGWRATNNK